MNKIDMLDDFEPRLTEMKRTNRSVSGFLRRPERDTTAFSGFDGASFRRGGAASLRLPPQEGRLRSRFYQLQA